jgi:hypothetical protein
MFVDPAEDPRSQEPVRGGEREVLMDYLHHQRQTLELKCSGLDPEQLARRSVEPSTLSLLGLVRHLGDVELQWTRQVMSGEAVERRYRRPDNLDGDFDDAVGDQAVVDEAWQYWRGEAENTDRFVSEAPDLGAMCTTTRGDELSVREIVVHLIEEYARHNGHADLLRERIDGRIGE